MRPNGLGLRAKPNSYVRFLKSFVLVLVNGKVDCERVQGSGFRAGADGAAPSRIKDK